MFGMLSDSVRSDLFFREPESIGAECARELIAHQLGGTLYMRGTQLGLARAISREGVRGTTCVVVCMEDAIGEQELGAAEANFDEALSTLQQWGSDDLPMIFARVREPGDVTRVCRGDSGRLISGFVLPKFSPMNADAWFNATTEAASLRGRRLWVMPVLESVELGDPGRRNEWLRDVKAVLGPEVNEILAVRVGATDIAGSLALRRSAGFTLYDVGPLRDALGAIVGTFASCPAAVPAISGCAYEHFTPGSGSPELKLIGGGEHDVRLSSYTGTSYAGIQTMAAELALDRVHGLVGKTAIHPSQVPLINAWQPVTHEEYVDAASVLTTSGATISEYANKMNEAQPHQRWAQKTLLRARASGVLAASVSWEDVYASTLVGTSHMASAIPSRAQGLMR